MTYYLSAGNKLVESLVREQLAACVNLVPGILLHINPYIMLGYCFVYCFCCRPIGYLYIFQRAWAVKFTFACSD